jgi:hypothetical protein
MKRVLMFLACGVVAATTATGAQSKQPPDNATVLRQGFGEVSGWITASAALVPPDKYSYRPSKDVRTFGELIGHIADGYNYFCTRATGKGVEWSDAVEKGATDKATLAGKLKTATAGCSAAHGGASANSPLLIQNYGHTNLHYGNVITYLRMMGLKPPSS